MKNIFKLFILTFSAISLSSCEDSIDLDLGAPVEQLVIDAVIDQTTDTQFVHITKSIAYLNNGGYTGVEVDTVGILDTSSNTFHTFTYKGNGWYYFVPAPNTFSFGNTYQLIVRDGADTYFSQSKLNSPTTVDSFTYKYEKVGPFGGTEGNYVTLWSKDKVGKGDYYWFKLYRNDSIQLSASDIRIANDNSTTPGGSGDGDLFIIPIRQNFSSRPYKTGETARIEILSITPEMYLYLNLINTQLNNQGLFAVPPSNVPSNIFCINNQNKKLLGFFCMTGMVSTPTITFQ
jgi:hypothetical protein